MRIGFALLIELTLTALFVLSIANSTANGLGRETCCTNFWFLKGWCVWKAAVYKDINLRIAGKYRKIVKVASKYRDYLCTSCNRFKILAAVFTWVYCKVLLASMQYRWVFIWIQSPIFNDTCCLNNFHFFAGISFKWVYFGRNLTSLLQTKRRQHGSDYCNTKML